MATHDHDPYSAHTESAVRYFPVSKGNDVIGYLWASETNDGISFLRRLAAERDTLVASVAWSERLDQAQNDGLTPLQALRHWVGRPEDPEAGSIPQGTPEERATGLRQLEEYANPGHREADDYDEAIRNRSEGWDSGSPLINSRPGYSFLADGPVRYLPVTSAGRLLGYLWASDAEDAADFLKHTAAGSAGFNAQGRWLVRLEEAKNSGLAANEVLRHLAGAPEDPVAGGVPAETEERIATSVRELEELAERDDPEDNE